MAEHSFEVPIMLSPENLTFEDVAKLNPFYDELRDFWDNSPVTASPASSLIASSSASSFRSDASGVGVPSWTFSSSTAPSEHNTMSWDGFLAPERYYSVHRDDFHQHCLPYKVHDKTGILPSISLRPDSDYKQPLQPARETKPSYYGLATSRYNDYYPRGIRPSHKKLFGEDGWLGCRPDTDVRSGKNKTKVLKDLGKKVKKHVEDLANDVARAYPVQLNQEARRPRIVQKSTIPISLDPVTQAKLYSDMEVMICVSANKFLVQQHYQGNLSVESIKKVTNFWGSKNRPQVVEFQFDQDTQRQLILYNIRTLRFNGECSTNPILLNSNLQNWKAIVKEMSVRTFCSPDSVIRKHLHDIQKILDMLGAPLDTFIAFQDLQMRTLALMKDNRLRALRSESNGSTSSFRRQRLPMLTTSM
ncbi:hypothetical protein MPDQ_000623 [Monascus purpureus]|uniref:Uncharacterized protein n=1 Tax=Monascus purpureus TaxID=5098 RepID=A0A507QTJ8_MONPU|nr:hypothetical protein MPDQ_000623 [Monascus purpureus]BDD55130.1 hypothetical protein MAP00_000681 [Monascus purpureus]